MKKKICIVSESEQSSLSWFATNSILPEKLRDNDIQVVFSLSLSFSLYLTLSFSLVVNQGKTAHFTPSVGL